MPVKLNKRNNLKNFIELLFKKENRRLNSISYIFCSDDYLLKINKLHLKHDYYTDIITFDLSDHPNKLNAEIYISVERVKDNAKTHQQFFKKELHRVIFHGALHLCGYKDKTKHESERMRYKEEKYLNLYFNSFT
jgi:probable rRNA maturation factor